MSEAALKLPEAESRDETCQFLTFKVGSEEYGVNLITVREIKGWQETTRLPNMPEYLRGVMNLRGTILPVFDLRMRFGGAATEPSARHVIIILGLESRDIGILVDGVSDILTVAGSDIKPAPETQSARMRESVDGLISEEDRMVVLLNPEHLFDEKTLEAASASAA